MGDRSQQAPLQGIGAAPGAAVGPAVVVDRPEIVIPDVDRPATAFAEAATSVAADLNGLADDARDRGRAEAAEVLEAQALMAEDTMLAAAVDNRLDGGAGLGDAIEGAADELRALFRGLDDPYLAARAADVDEVIDRIAARLAGVAPPSLATRQAPAVYVARELTVAETAQVDPAQVLGFVTETGGPTSHVVIVARSMGVPAVVGLGGGTGLDEAEVVEGDVVAIDGATGEVVVRPDDPTLDDFTARVDRHRREVAAAATWRGRTATFGTEPIAVAANVAGPADLDQAVAEGADGIGLLRTEFLFLDRPAPPDEDEQYEFYANAASSFEAPVVIRAFDIGGDKPAPYLSVPAEQNPFLGIRGARLYRRHPEVFETQVRAVLRAAAVGDVWLMLPMVTTASELVELRAWIGDVAASMAPGVEARVPKLGAMVEVPALALSVDAVVDHADFLSIGSNDLTQYTLAADRTSEGLGHLQDALHPSVLRLCAMVADAGRRTGTPVSVCGLSAADPLAGAAYAALGIDKLSVSPAMVNRVKAGVSALRPDPGPAVVTRALARASAEQARADIDAWAAQR